MNAPVTWGRFRGRRTNHGAITDTVANGGGRGSAGGRPMTDQRARGDGETNPTPGAAVGGRWRLSPLGMDVAVAVVLFGASVVNVANQDPETKFSDIPAAGFLLLAIASTALLWRRGRSLAVLGVALVMTVAWASLGYPGNPVFHILVSLYAVGRYVPEWRLSLAALAAALAVAGLVQAIDGDPLSDVVTGLVLTALAWLVGRLLQNRANSARERAEYLEWKRATEAERVIADARAGIARELHDVVAHNVSVMTVQAGVARLVVRDDPDRAVEAIGVVEEAGRSALDELRHLLGVLRPEAASGDLDPQPALHQVHKLVDQLSKTGMSVSLTSDIPSDLPVRVDLFAYRIVQEALTNVLKHGGVDATAQVRLEEADGYLDIEVTDSGASTTSLPGSGQGIVGMEERANLLGGIFEAGPRSEGGFRVFARLPIGDQ
ncbi:MAG: sensor histidine kinase [bacterium]|nr:sensor histidine kinase [bacterium]MCP4964226.1 sensor histidine kinase [bacterium]